MTTIIMITATAIINDDNAYGIVTITPPSIMIFRTS